MSAAIPRGDEQGAGRWWRALASVLLAVCLLACIQVPGAMALKSVPLSGDVDMVEITEHAELLSARGDSVQVETAPGPDGMTGRMSVRASASGLSPNWLVFALRNATDRPMERWVTAERYSLIGSGVVWPNLDSRRIEAITPSLGFLPERIPSDRADLFKITLEPGQTITYAAELATERFGRIYVWKPVEYELKTRDRQLYNGILLGITGVLGIFLTAVFAANHKPIFPSAALVTWCVLAYLCVDFGFFHKLFNLRPQDNAVYRAATEAAMAASLLVFLHIFLRLTALPSMARMLLVVWIIAQISLVGLALIDARLASTFARASFAGIGAVGMLAIGYLALRGQDRALSLLPTWILFFVWLFAATVTLTGRMQGDAVVSSLTGGLVLLTVLVGFTVTQFAFRSIDNVNGDTPSEQTLRSMAIDGSGASVWEWNVRRDEVRTGPLVEATLGLSAGELTTKSEDFCAHLHPADRERFRLLLWSVKERSGGDIRLQLRMLHADNSERWFDLEASAAPSSDRRSLRCVGLMRDITESKLAQERLLHDAVHDTLTGLPNRELFLDRLGVAVERARREPMIMPAVVLIDIDKFRSVNAAFGVVVGDSLLLTLARRLQHHLGPQDTLARIDGNQFALMLMQAHDVNEILEMAETIRRSVRSPIRIAGQDVALTAALGIAIWDDKIATAADLVKDAEVAMYRAKRAGADRVETFHPQMRSEVDNRVAVEAELRAALDRRELIVMYQPIMALATRELAGFEALVRWQHPKLGLLLPGDFIPIAEGSDLIVQLGSQVMAKALEDSAQWHKLLPRQERPLFVSINVSSRQLFRSDLVQEVRQMTGRTLVPPGSVRLEITETLVMENPERAVEILDQLRSAGVGLALDDFGTGYSSLAYLNRFPFDTIKIDRDLVQSSAADGTGSAIVRSIVALAHELGKKVVAEGVDIDTDVSFLRSIGCEYAQGFLWGEPMSQRDAERMVRNVAKTEKRIQRVGLFKAKTKRRSKAADEAMPPHETGAFAPVASPSSTPAQPTGEGGSIGERLIGKGMRTRSRTGGTGPRKGSSRQDAPPAPAASPVASQASYAGVSPVAASGATAPEVPRDYADAIANGAANGAYNHPLGESQPAYWPPVANGYQNGPPPPPLPAGAPSIAAPLADLAGILAGAGASSGIGVTAPGAPGAGLQLPADPVPPALRPADPLPGSYPNGAGHEQRAWTPQDPSTTRPDQPARQQPADLSSLPPAIAASLARLSRTARPSGGGEGG
jgi:diguanylate cyclase (GGDEF)-like protein/PAS domain S-box-containing protein